MPLSTTVATSNPIPVGESQPSSGPAQLEIEHQAGHRADDGRCAEVVDRGLARDVMQLERHRGDDQRGDADRHVDEEDPLPAQVVGEQPPSSGPATEETPKTAPNIPGICLAPGAG